MKHNPLGNWFDRKRGGGANLLTRQPLFPDERKAVEKYREIILTIITKISLIYFH